MDGRFLQDSHDLNTVHPVSTPGACIFRPSQKYSKMDVHGSLGYNGSNIVFISDEQYGFVTGNAFYVMDLVKGPRSIKWCLDDGIQKAVVHHATSSLVLAPYLPGSIPMMHISEDGKIELKGSIPNPLDDHIVDLCFSYNGDFLFAISGELETSFLCWSLESSTPNLVFNKKLDSNYYPNFAINPIDRERFVFYGESGASFCTVKEINGKHLIKFTALTLPKSSQFDELLKAAKTDEERKAVNDSHVNVTFVMWLPGDMLLMGNVAGIVFKVEPKKNYAFTVLDMKTPGSPTASASCGVLTSDGVIIGSTSGLLSWYRTEDFEGLVSPEGDFEKNLVLAIQIANVYEPITSIGMSPNFETIYVGTKTSKLFHFAVDINEKLIIGEDLDDSMREKELEDNVVTEVSALKSVVYNQGMILCADSMTFPANDDFVSVFVTGTDLGMVSFWLQPSVDADPIAPNEHTIRKSLPRSIKLIAALQVGVIDANIPEGHDAPNPDSPHGVLSMVVLPNRKDTSILLVGMVSGWLETWQVQSQEVDEEDFADGQDENQIKLNFTRLKRQQLFATEVSILSHITETSYAPALIAVGSFYGSYVYILSETKDKIFDVLMYFNLGNENLPRSMKWNSNSSLWVACENGTLQYFWPHEVITSDYSIFSDNELTAHKSFDTGIVEIIGAAITGPTALMVSNMNSIEFSMFDLNNDMVQSGGAYGDIINLTTAQFCSEHTEIPFVNAISPNGLYWVTGCVDGSIFVWNIVDGGDVSLLCKVCLHKDTVLALTFSKDSSLLLTCGLDGSTFIVSIAKPSNKATKKEKFDLSCVKMAQERVEYVANVGGIWLEQRKVQYDALIFKKYEPERRRILDEINHIAARVESMIKENEEKPEDERLPLEAFCIDIEGRDALAAQHARELEELRLKHEDFRFMNEMEAAQIRAMCYDTMEVNSYKIVPLLVEDKELREVYKVDSFAITKQSAEEKALLERLRLMRCIEMRSQQKHFGGSCEKLPGGQFRVSWITSTKGLPADISFIYNEGTLWPTESIMDRLIEQGKADNEKEKQKEENKEDNNEATAALVLDDDDGSETAETERTVDEKSIVNLLYPPTALRTPIQKKSQVVFLKEIVRLIRRKFNEHFDRVKREKEDVLAGVESRNARIEVIMSELHIQEELTKFSLEREEIEDFMITVDESKMESKPIETEEQKRIRLEEEERKRKEAEKDKEDVKGRALMEMMNGTLEIKIDVMDSASHMQRPAWMDDIPKNQMTEAQVKEVEAFDERMKQMQEESVKYKKALEVELKKLKAEIMDSAKTFDERLLQLSRLKIAAQREVYAQELYICMLTHNVVKRDREWTKLKTTEKEMETVQQVRSGVRSDIDDFGTKVEEAKAAYMAAQEEDRGLEKSFKRDMQNLCNVTFDQESLKIFTQLFKKRTYPIVEEEDEEFEGSEVLMDASKASASQKASQSHGASKSNRMSASKGNRQSKARMSGSKAGKMKASKGASAGGKKSMGPMQLAAQALQKSGEEVKNGQDAVEKDPFLQAIRDAEDAKKKTERDIPLMVPLSLDADCPDGFNVDQFTWSQLQELRNAKIQKEIVVKQLYLKFTERKNQMQILVNEDNEILEKLTSLQNIFSSKRQMIYNLDNNIEIQLFIKQGQDEVDDDALVTDYSDAIFIPTSMIENLNEKIKEVGEEKIAVLEKIKNFRREINLLQWEEEHLNLEANHYEELYKDLQLMRVTREVQAILREGDNQEKKSKEKAERMRKQKEFMQKAHEEEVAKMRLMKEKLEKKLVERQRELEMIERQSAAMSVELAECQAIKTSLDEARGEGGDNASMLAKKMKAIVKRRHLVDTARQQAEEIDHLRQEVDRLRQRTFPSFVRKIRSDPDAKEI